MSARWVLSMRAGLVGLIVVATIGFVIGTSVERHNSARESSAQMRAEGVAAHAAEGGGAESTATHADESGHAAATPTHTELRPLGVNVEAVPFTVLAALASLTLAALGWVRPRWLLGLVAIAAAMTVFGALDVREAVHQSDENHTGLVVLAAVIATLHLAAVGTAVVMAGRRRAAHAYGS